MGQDSQGKAAVFGGILGRIEVDRAAAAAALDGLLSQSRGMPSVLGQGTRAAEGCICQARTRYAFAQRIKLAGSLGYGQPWLWFESAIQAQRVNFFQTISRFVARST
jgi:cell wall-associated NlpC family hydrolase